MGMAKYYEDNYEMSEERICGMAIGRDPILVYDSTSGKSYKSQWEEEYNSNKSCGHSKSKTAYSNNRGKSSKKHRSSGNTNNYSNANLLNQLVYLPQYGLGTVIYASNSYCKVKFSNSIRQYSPTKARKYLTQACYCNRV